MNRLYGNCLLVWFVLVSIGTATPASGADWGLSWLGRSCLPDCVGRWCCDDYHPKPLPCPQPVNCFGCDDYCAKPLPCAIPVRHFCCDDYCRKCLPPVCFPPRCDLDCPPAGCPVSATQTPKLVDVDENAAPNVVRLPARSSGPALDAASSDRR